MAIKVDCACGKSFGVKEELRGRKVKCPGCNSILVVGQSPAEGSEPRRGAPAAVGGVVDPVACACACGKKFTAPAKLVGKKVKCPACGQGVVVPGRALPTKEAGGLSELLDEVGYDQEKTKESCPECGVTLTPNAVICVACGLNLETGKKLRTKNYSELAKNRINRTRLK